jgi:glycosyltransferase involved in cell wall biosynthesis
LKIAFATISDSRDIRRGSGTFYNLAREIERQGHSLERVGPIELRWPIITRLTHKLHRWIGRRHPIFLDPFVGALTGREVARQLAREDYDVLLTNDMCIAAFTEETRPKVLYTDVMLTADYSEGGLPHSRLNGMTPFSLWLARRSLRAGVEASDLCVFPAMWLLHEIDRYGWSPKHTSVIPFGANVDDPGLDVLKQRAARRLNDQAAINLLFLAKDWNHKGGDLAVETVMELRRRGVPAVLHAIGSRPARQADPDAVRLYGLLDKTDAGHRARLDECFKAANLMLLCSRREGLVIAALEAAAYGLPVLAFNAIGVNSAVVDGRTGLLLDCSAGPKDFANAIMRLLQNESEYRALCKGARQHYETSANWRTCVSTLMECIERVLPGIPAARYCDSDPVPRAQT